MRPFVVTVVLLCAAPLFSATPGGSLEEGKRRLAAGNCRGAAEVLRDGLAAAASLAEPERSVALPALHFYTALSHSVCGEEQAARGQLREFFRLKPGQSTLDAAKFPRAFIDLFRDEQKGRPSSDTFDRFYSGYDHAAPVAEERLALALWGTSPAYQILADAGERAAWETAGHDARRQSIIEEFWARRPAREQIQRRVAFADRAFNTAEDVRGALTDRGRVFVLLGAPARVYRSGLQRYETTLATNRVRTPLTGSMERWIYFHQQLPGSVPAHQVEFRFITHPGYGEAVMQKDFLPLKALAEARKTLSSGEE